MRVRSDDVFLAFIVAMIVLVSGIVFAAHWNDAVLKAECEAQGGTFVHASQPLHVCVKTVDQPIVHPK